MATPITEESGVHKTWYEEARKMTREELPAFIGRLSDEYEHDYGTICHAIAAAAVAAAWAVERSPHGGVSGFQAGAIMWEFCRHWMSWEDSPRRLQNMEHLLFPQYEHQFNGISVDTWEWLQKEARLRLNGDLTNVHEPVARHWRSICDGVVPFGLYVDSEE